MGRFLNFVCGHKPQTDEEIISEFERGVSEFQSLVSQHISSTVEDSETTIEADSDLDENIVAMIEMTVDQNSQLNIHIKWNKTDDKTSETIGKMLFNMNRGNFEQACANILLGVSRQHPESKGFIKKCFVSWKKNKDNEPVLKPSDVFKMGSHPEKD